MISEIDLFIPRLKLLTFEDFYIHVIECNNPVRFFPPHIVLVSFPCEDFADVLCKL